jgi:hypothetical protein
MNSPTERSNLLLFAWLAFCAAGCQASGNHSPSIDLFGSYFPAWLVCIFAGLAMTLIARQFLIALELGAHVRPAPLVYPSLLIVFTLAVWLAFYKN